VPYAARKVYRERGDAAARFGDPWTSRTFMPWYERYERQRRGDSRGRSRRMPADFQYA